MDYITGKAKDINTVVNSLLWKCGYDVVSVKFFKLALLVGYDNYEVKPQNDYKQEAVGIVWGFDMTTFRKEGDYIDFSIYFSENANYQENGIKVSGKDASLGHMKAKWSLPVNEHLGMTWGVRIDGFSLNDHGFSTGNYILGMFYQF